jgi:hypothetical protein
MPDLRRLMASAATAAEPSTVPAFSSLRTRARRRTQRRLAGAAAVVAVVAAAGVAVASGGGTQHPQPLVAPCVERTDENAHDVFAEIPTSGTKTVDLFTHDYLTVGWKTCDETGTLTTPSLAKSMLSPSGESQPGLASNRYLVFGTGTTSITGEGSAGSRGQLVLHVTQRPEPVGMSSASPYPTNAAQYAGPELCKAGDVTDDQGYLTKTVTYDSSQHLMEPPGAVRSRLTRAQVLDKAARGEFRLAGPGVTAAFGLLTAQNYGGGTRLPRWIVYECDAHAERDFSGPPRLGPTPAPGTSPSPFGHSYQVQLSLFDENLAQVYTSYFGYDDDATLAQQFVEVPFERTHDDSADGRQIGISYPTYGCATFSHLEVYDPAADSPIHARVWLRVTGDVPCEESGRATAVLGLRFPIGDREVIRGEARR